MFKEWCRCLGDGPPMFKKWYRCSGDGALRFTAWCRCLGGGPLMFKKWYGCSGDAPLMFEERRRCLGGGSGLGGIFHDTLWLTQVAWKRAIPCDPTIQPSSALINLLIPQGRLASHCGCTNLAAQPHAPAENHWSWAHSAARLLEGPPKHDKNRKPRNCPILHFSKSEKQNDQKPELKSCLEGLRSSRNGMTPPAMVLRCSRNGMGTRGMVL